MDDVRLFTNSNGEPVTRDRLSRALHEVGAGECDVLFVHSGLGFGTPDPEVGRTGLLSALWETVLALRVPTVCIPTFTFSFPNGEDYDRDRSRTRMGALNEFVRRLPGSVRSVDPIMSVTIHGRETSLVDSIGKYSCGAGSTYDLLHRRGGGVVFLFFGVRCYECFTFSHYVEERACVPFRYQKPFRGRITAGDRTWEDTYFHYARYNGVRPVQDDRLERDLWESGLLRRVPVGNSFISAVDEDSAFAAIGDRLARDSFYLADRAYTREEMLDTAFLERDIVAL